jgi:hypothetical protein
MASTRRLVLLAGIAALSVISVPAFASADVYCVDTVPLGCDHIGYTGSTGLQQALTDAQAHTGGDTVKIGAGTYATTTPAGFSYNATDPVTVTGNGQGSTIISVPAAGSVPGSFTFYAGLNIFGAGSSVSGLSVSLPTPPGGSSNQRYVGVRAEANNSSVNNVTVQAPNADVDAVGVFMANGTLVDSTMSLPLGFSPGTRGVWELAGTTSDLFLNHNTITADTGVTNDNQSSGETHIDRSVIRSTFIGMQAEASHMEVTNSVIGLGSSNGATAISVGYSNPNANTSTLTADGITIYGAGTGQRGIVVSGLDANTTPNAGDPDIATAAVSNTIINLIGTSPIALDRQANHNGIVNLTTNYSDYDASTIVDSGNPNGATGSITQQNQLNVDPDFVSPGTNLHLKSTSPLIDAGNPAGPSFGAKDIDGDDRVILGKDGCAARRDIGADEFMPGSPPTLLDCTPPDTSFLSGPTGTIADNTPTFTFDSSEQPATFECSLDGASTQPCTSPFTFVPLPDGPHTLAVQAIDGSSNVDPTPATRSFTVDTTAPETAIGSHPKPKTKSRTATFTFSSSETGSTFLCSYDSKPYAACGASFTTPKLTRGLHRFDVLATDSVGNRDQSAATFLWKIKKRKKRR